MKIIQRPGQPPSVSFAQPKGRAVLISLIFGIVTGLGSGSWIIGIAFSLAIANIVYPIGDEGARGV